MTEQTIAAWQRASHARLAAVIGADEAARDLRLILMRATGWSAARLGISALEPLAPDVAAQADAMLAARLTHQPLAQILGQWGFYGRDFLVTRDTLVPRPDTETLVELALAAPFARLIDLGTGSGAIAVTLLAEHVTATGLASDISQAALDVAARNAARHGVGERLALHRADWWEGVSGAFDLIVSNPPYIGTSEADSLTPEVRDCEPALALFAGADGLSVLEPLIAGVAAWLRPGGLLLLEIGAAQSEAVLALIGQNPQMDAASVIRDLAGRPRIVRACRR